MMCNKKIVTIGLISLLLLISFPSFPAGNIVNIEKNLDKTEEECQTCNNNLNEPPDENQELYYFGGAYSIPEDYYIPPDPIKYNMDPPEEWDWRDVEYNGIHGDWTTPVKYQGWCGSCWDFAAIGALEAVISIRENDPTLDIDLSEQHILSCSNAGSCNGGLSIKVFEWMVNNNKGAIPEDCFPYQANDGIPCSEICEEWMNQHIPIKDTDGDGNAFGYWSYAGDDFIKGELINKGPLVARMIIYEDFKDYEGGVYQHEWGDPEGGHAVVLVGYKDTPNNPDYDGYWICKNSFGKSWGEDGYFRIAYGEANIGYQTVYVEYEAGGFPELFADAIIDVNRWNPPPPGTNIDFYGVAAGGTKPYSWHWDFDDGEESNKRDPSHVYLEAGWYNVTLTVTDAEGNISIDVDQILVDTAPEPPIIDGPTKGSVGVTYSYNFSAEDRDGDDLYYTIWWGHGDEEYIGFLPSGEVFELSHTWEQKGNYQILVEAEDPYQIRSWSESYVTMPRNRAMNTPFLNFLQNHPNLFPILLEFLDASLSKTVTIGPLEPNDHIIQDINIGLFGGITSRQNSQSTLQSNLQNNPSSNPQSQP